MNGSDGIIQFYGITKDFNTNNFMMVMEYADDGNLRQRLNRDFNSLNWNNKFHILNNIISGLGNIHEKGLIHQDFHSGNILNHIGNSMCITDLGLCKPANKE